MKQHRLGQNVMVGAVGLGCMGMSEFYGPADPDEGVNTIRTALDMGVTLLDTSDMYGMGANEELVGRAISGRRDGVVVATKFGIRRDGGRTFIDNSPDYARRACEASLRRLGLDTIDIFYCHRHDAAVAIEEVVGAMGELVASGKVRYLGLSEVNSETLRRACEVHPVAALQSEWSLFSREIENEIVDTARELGVGIVPYAPLGRGLLTGSITSSAVLSDGDARRNGPRFEERNLERNLELLENISSIARQVDCTPAQLALAWLIHQGDDVVPIPGTKRVRYLKENIAAAEALLDDTVIEELDRLLPQGTAAGSRYPESGDLDYVQKASDAQDRGSDGATK